MSSDDPRMLAREAHYQRFLGPMNDNVMHSTDVKPVHIDIYQFEPTEERPYWTLITGGMSDQRQIQPEDCAEHMSPRSEIMMYVTEPKPWMFDVLKGLAEMPFDHDTFLHWWHTVPNGKPMTAEPSELTSYFFVPPYFEAVEFGDLKIEDDLVDVLLLIPITDSERAYARQHGSQAFEKLIEKVDLSPVVDESRTSIV
ncbi:suppressor of fused domain protein [Rubinisphaera margarita]|uniref:suppressor of fused domain protein n=1 Tax=Rubinisphaera margarita TaxID=2909586 RepID=UPI001EE7CD5E|nr:suppressor of fused domain protein [Rubinisphaera margarita]MCG6155072.1 suppressor of fused domain protein [Rubinisphaera margarita]